MDEKVKNDLIHKKKILDQHYNWPCKYLFKFIILTEQKEEFHSTFPEIKQCGYQSKPSSEGKYISITFSAQVTSSDDVIAIYTKAQKINGLIAL